MLVIFGYVIVDTICVIIERRKKRLTQKQTESESWLDSILHDPEVFRGEEAKAQNQTRSETGLHSQHHYPQT